MKQKEANLGMGVMINMLFGDGRKTNEALMEAIGRTITSVEIKDLDSKEDREREENQHIVIGLDNGKKLIIFDSGQSCCESRYITTDADLPSYIGKSIMGFRQGEYKGVEDDHGESHDCQSLLIDTSEGVIDFVTHVEHNGYYGGFSIQAKLTD